MTVDETGVMSHVEVHRDDEGSRYLALVDGEPAGLVDFRARAGVVNLLHVEVDVAYRGRGIASAMVRYAMDDVRARSMSVIPTCPYAQRWLEKHPADADLVAS